MAKSGQLIDQRAEAAAEPRILRALIRLILLATSAVTIIALFADRYWFAELFTHFRLYYLLAQAVLLLVFLHRQHPVLLAVTFVLALPNAWAVGPYLTPLVMRDDMPATTDGVRVAALNLNYRRGNALPVRAYIENHDPDVLILQELTPRWRTALDEVTRTYPYSVVEPRAGAFGVGVYSKLPLASARVLDFGSPDTANVHAVLDPDGLDLELFAIHLYPPTGPERARHRNAQLQMLAKNARAAGSRALVIGDLNLTPFSPYFERLLQSSGLADARRPRGLHVTWPTLPLPIWIPIDHCLAGDSVHVPYVGTGPNIGSDHYPLELVVGAARAAGSKVAGGPSPRAIH